MGRPVRAPHLLLLPLLGVRDEILYEVAWGLDDHMPSSSKNLVKKPGRRCVGDRCLDGASVELSGLRLVDSGPQVRIE